MRIKYDILRYIYECKPDSKQELILELDLEDKFKPNRYFIIEKHFQELIDMGVIIKTVDGYEISRESGFIFSVFSSNF